MNIFSPITMVKGVGEKTSKLFEKIGVYTVGDILLRFPRNYTQYPKIECIDEIETMTEGYHAICAQVKRSVVVKKTKTMQVSILVIGQEGNKMELVWYRMPYIKSQLEIGKFYVFYGKVVVKNGHYVMEQSIIYDVEKYQKVEERFLPVYALTNGLTNNVITKTIQAILSDETLFHDYIPNEYKEKYQLCEYNYALKQIHFPDDMDTLIEARKRLVFDEFFLFILGIQYQKGRQNRKENTFKISEDHVVKDIISHLPYKLTNAQIKTLEEIKNDMTGPYVMQRLVQGDVGSGKTIIAFLSMLICAQSGYQSAIMAPTEVLARQHFESFQSMCFDFGLDIPLIFISGSMTTKQKREAYERLKTETNAMIIGTHALIQEKPEYASLALVITDEQHRFGVKQRDAFSNKGNEPHILVMSATPIPRTLAIIIYGDMDISVIDEVPAKRLPIKNCVVNTAYRSKAYSFMEEQIKMGHQVYIICPFVEASQNMDGENVVEYVDKIRSHFSKDIIIEALHGKMKNDKKNEIMEQFAKNEIQILVSTTVVEVGVNVPNATVMMIEDANRFGLAQLHQLRGRVGRGDSQSFCIMINNSNSKNSKKRLEILNNSNDGFYIASEDLKLRGPGDFFGIRQSGEMGFHIADVYQDANILQLASEAVKETLENDVSLEKEEHQLLKAKIEGYMEENFSKMNL